MKLNIGIIGCGGIANGKHLPSLEKISEASLVAFCDIDKAKAQLAAETYGSDDSKVYEDYRDLLADKTIDIVHICTPNNTHKSITVDALDAGKHVMCEKPMAKTTDEAREMINAAKRNKKKLTIGYQNRFRGDSQYLRKVTQRGDLGEIYFSKAHAIRRRAVPTWGVFLDEEKQGGGPLIDIGTHALDLTLWMMDNYEPESVMGSTFHKLGQQENAANAWGSWDPKQFNVEDSAFGFIKMKNGATIILESSWALNSLEVDEAKCSLSGTQGGADMKDGLRIHGEDLGTLYTSQIEIDNPGVDFFDSESIDEAEEEARAWVQCIIDDTEPIVKPEEALVVTQILEAIYHSAKTGKAVYLNQDK
ncbi:Gfo/Idh/MocA family oxidoreductase [Staphylococcus gallinarum]|uniref:Gfo/Idh/MocA family protein n=1 Tax=Staphylococcus gallinarum TaxID=1293 RepID=UPI000D1C73F8|nr:Gfo/Idh/MocA family oxidoreductase [Staphylococcus gallinarum]MBU7217919.1 Gfo/Idh/MocA family oxidoreductase [Staphylococcus gallinarum]MCD8787319.1 Gfo/Idh/MocA family oxidoreductase [Staphylococcus gallinarum]MCD8793972.1 Gfo/Idh/MocA family oxidoreductase [Staphylococcus gallinarum]MCD8829671.1 Gfo/Idh/MocA family oxidoreductase [Staphylococcus gallinarum]MCD8843813.1 Gfo/Idh/MocA family oxidoreductase [Staphylococcus gallinarum]